MKNNYNYVLFDLDGTLTDPAIGITNSLMHALNKFGISVNDRQDLNKYIGPPLRETFTKYFGFTIEGAEEAIEAYREYFGDKGLYENEVYPGVNEFLAKLNSEGKKVILATSKPIYYATKILEHFDLLKYFDFVAGSNMDGTRSNKCEVIQYALDSNSISDKSSAIMVGDREHDIIGAKQCGIDSIGVLFGYGNREEFEKAGANYIVDSIDEIINVIL